MSQFKRAFRRVQLEGGLAPGTCAFMPLLAHTPPPSHTAQAHTYTCLLCIDLAEVQQGSRRVNIGQLLAVGALVVAQHLRGGKGGRGGRRSRGAGCCMVGTAAARHSPQSQQGPPSMTAPASFAHACAAQDHGVRATTPRHTRVRAPAAACPPLHACTPPCAPHHDAHHRTCPPPGHDVACSTMHAVVVGAVMVGHGMTCFMAGARAHAPPAS